MKKIRLLSGLIFGVLYLQSTEFADAGSFYMNTVRNTGIFNPRIEILNNFTAYTEGNRIVPLDENGKKNRDQIKYEKELNTQAFNYVFGHDMVTGKPLTNGTGPERWRQKVSDEYREVLASKRIAFCNAEMDYRLCKDKREEDSVRAEESRGRISAYMRALLATWINNHEKMWYKDKKWHQSIENLADLASDIIANDGRKYNFDDQYFYSSSYRNGYGIKTVLQQMCANITENCNNCRNKIKNVTGHVVGEQDVPGTDYSGDSYLNLCYLNKWLFGTEEGKYVALNSSVKEKGWDTAFKNLAFFVNGEEGVVINNLLNCCVQGVLQSYDKNLEVYQQEVEKVEAERTVLTEKETSPRQWLENKIKTIEDKMPHLDLAEYKAALSKLCEGNNSLKETLKKVEQWLDKKIKDINAKVVYLETIKKQYKKYKISQSLSNGIDRSIKLLNQLTGINESNKKIYQNYTGGNTTSVNKENGKTAKEYFKNLDEKKSKKANTKNWLIKCRITLAECINDSINKKSKEKGNFDINIGKLAETLSTIRESIPALIQMVTDTIENKNDPNKEVTSVSKNLEEKRVIKYFDNLGKLSGIKDYEGSEIFIKEILKTFELLRKDAEENANSFFKKIMEKQFNEGDNAIKSEDKGEKQFREELRTKIRNAYFQLCHDIQVYLHDTGLLDTNDWDWPEGIFKSAYALVNSSGAGTASRTNLEQNNNKYNNTLIHLNSENKENPLGNSADNKSETVTEQITKNERVSGYSLGSGKKNTYNDNNNSLVNNKNNTIYDRIGNTKNELTNPSSKAVLSLFHFGEQLEFKNSLMTPGIVRKAAVMYYNMVTPNTKMAMAQRDRESRIKYMDPSNEIAKKYEKESRTLIGNFGRLNNDLNVLGNKINTEIAIARLNGNKGMIAALTQIQEGMRTVEQSYANTRNSCSNVDNCVENIKTSAMFNKGVAAAQDETLRFLLSVLGLTEDYIDKIRVWLTIANYEDIHDRIDKAAEYNQERIAEQEKYLCLRDKLKEEIESTSTDGEEKKKKLKDTVASLENAIVGLTTYQSLSTKGIKFLLDCGNERFEDEDQQEKDIIQLNGNEQPRTYDNLKTEQEKITSEINENEKNLKLQFKEATQKIKELFDNNQELLKDKANLEKIIRELQEKMAKTEQNDNEPEPENNNNDEVNRLREELKAKNAELEKIKKMSLNDDAVNAAKTVMELNPKTDGVPPPPPPPPPPPAPPKLPPKASRNKGKAINNSRVPAADVTQGRSMARALMEARDKLKKKGEILSSPRIQVKYTIDGEEKNFTVDLTDKSDVEKRYSELSSDFENLRKKGLTLGEGNESKKNEETGAYLKKIMNDLKKASPMLGDRADLLRQQILLRFQNLKMHEKENNDSGSSSDEED